MPNSKAALPKLRQLTFNRRGGARRGAGRKRKGPEQRIRHAARDRMTRREPVHVTLRLQHSLSSLRQARSLHVLKTAFARSNALVDTHGLRIVHFAI